MQVEIFDLAGRSLGVVWQEPAASGRFSVAWDGRDGDGALLPPGLYLVRLSVESDKTEDTRQGSIVPRFTDEYFYSEIAAWIW